MPTRVIRLDDYHIELANQVAIGPIRHPFTSSPAATQAVLACGGHPLLREGDRFRNEGLSHQKPLAGTAFASPPGVTGWGQFTAAVQDVFFVDGRPVMTTVGRLETCSDAACEASVDAAVILTEVPVLFVNDAPVLPGNS
jgi:hypothetical protein